MKEGEEGKLRRARLLASSLIADDKPPAKVKYPYKQERLQQQMEEIKAPIMVMSCLLTGILDEVWVHHLLRCWRHHYHLIERSPPRQPSPVTVLSSRSPYPTTFSSYVVIAIKLFISSILVVSSQECRALPPSDSVKRPPGRDREGPRG